MGDERTRESAKGKVRGISAEEGEPQSAAMGRGPKTGTSTLQALRMVRWVQYRWLLQRRVLVSAVLLGVLVTIFLQGSFVDQKGVSKVLHLIPLRDSQTFLFSGGGGERGKQPRQADLDAGDFIDLPVDGLCETVPRVSNISMRVYGHRIDIIENMREAPKHLNVFVILHSHVDPGWLETFDEYYIHKVNKIIDNVVDSLTKYKDLKFIWSEISFLERWWTTSDESRREKFMSLLEEGRLEIPGGSWVMTDEATPYFWSTIDNMIVGHQFLLKHLNVTSNTSWSVDPFGHGLMMPYLLKLSGIDYMVIGRIHSLLKDDMRQAHRLHYRWAQPWDSKLQWTTMVNVLPRMYYTTINACGPDQSVCCTFDVSPSSMSVCPKANAESAEDIEKYATAMADQYRKLQPYYNSESVLVAAGDDFGYFGDRDLPTVQKVYSALFKYINSHKDFDMTVQFGTVSDYFNSLDKSKESGFLTGDFFPYLDSVQGHPYWTGFYNHRPYHKRLERIIQGKLRSLDLLSILTKAGDVSEQNEVSRRDLALFQHHDAITATSKRPVMKDYLDRLKKGLQNIITEQELFVSKLLPEKDVNVSSVDSLAAETSPFLLPQRIASFSSTQESLDLVIVNQHSVHSRQLVTLLTHEVNVEVLYKGKAVDAQIGPFFNGETIVHELYSLSFFMTLDAFSITKVQLRKSKDLPKSTTVSMVAGDDVESVFPPLQLVDNAFLLETEKFALSWNFANGLKNTFYLKDINKRFAFNLRFAAQRDSGGAYVMLTIKQPYSILPHPPTNVSEVVAVKGPLYSAVYNRVSPEIGFSLVVPMDATAPASPIHLELFPDVQELNDQTIMMRLETSIDNSDVFYTDVNGLYFIRRRYNSTLPVEANIYPMGSASLIEDSSVRCTVLGGQPTGATSDSKGTVNVMVDRRQTGDDGKGVGYGEASESYPSQLKYRILLESRAKASGEDTIYHSAIAHHSFDELLYPPTLFFTTAFEEEEEKVVEGLLPPLPCNVQLINMRYISKDVIIVLLRRLPFDCSVSETTNCNTDTTSVADFFMAVGGKIYSTNLTGTSKGASLKPSEVEATLLTPLHIVSFMVELTNNP